MIEYALAGGPAPPTDDEEVGFLTFEAVEGDVRLRISVDSKDSRLMVRVARHDGATDALMRRVLDRLCAIVVGRPLQEAADHGAIYVVAELAQFCAPVDGIRLPRNAGPAFAVAERLVRQVHAAARRHANIGHRENAWYRRMSAHWLSQDESAQMRAIKPMVESFLQDHTLDVGDIFITRIERGSRVTVGFSARVSYKVKPKLMLALERRLRDMTGGPLELFADDMKDGNAIRRL